MEGWNRQFRHVPKAKVTVRELRMRHAKGGVLGLLETREGVTEPGRATSAEREDAP